jgi:DNA-binding HxlR family transcriptional regulator
MKHRGRRSDCPIHFALETFGDSWSLLIVRDLLLAGGATYTELLHAREGISTNILANRLARLEQSGIVARADGGRYELTPKGTDLFPILRAIIAWSAKHDPETPVSPATAQRLRAGGDDAEVMAEMRANWKRRRGQHHG